MAVITYLKSDTSKLSQNFKVSEFKCKCGKYCNEIKVDEKLVDHLQKIRDHFGAPVRINSAYRCPTHNKNVGGSSSSLHMEGKAADITVDGVAPKEVAKYAESLGVLGIGLYETDKDGYFVHVDTRITKSFWYGQACKRRETFGGSTVNTEVVPKKLYLVHVGAFANKEDAEKASAELEKTGYSTCVIKVEL